MQVTCVLLADQLSEEGVGWFLRVKEIADQLVIFVRERRASAETRARIDRLGASVYATPSSDYYLSTAHFREMLAKCAGEWILMLDHDEELSAEWDGDEWRVALRQNEFSHFWLPRRWLTSSSAFLNREPWWPDWQLRLFRNLPAEIEFPAQLHDTFKVSGDGGWLPNLAIHHHDLRLASRCAREKKVELYQQLRQDHSLGYFYLFEDFAVADAALPTVNTSRPADEMLRMEPLTAEEMVGLRLRAEPPPEVIVVGSLSWLPIEIDNACNRSIGTGAPFPINLSYHWVDAVTQQFTIFDGVRTSLFPAVPPKTVGRFELLLIAPKAPGTYLLQIALVQEKVRWFLPITFTVEVVIRN